VGLFLGFFWLLLNTANRKCLYYGGLPPNDAPQKRTHLGSTQEVNNHKWKSSQKSVFRSRVNQNATKSASFELGLMVGAKRAFLNVTPSNDFHAYSFDKSVHFVRSDMSEIFLLVIGLFLMMRQTNGVHNCRLWPNQPVPYLRTLWYYYVGTGWVSLNW